MSDIHTKIDGLDKKGLEALLKEAKRGGMKLDGKQFAVTGNMATLKTRLHTIYNQAGDDATATASGSIAAGTASGSTAAATASGSTASAVSESTTATGQPADVLPISSFVHPKTAVCFVLLDCDFRPKLMNATVDAAVIARLDSKLDPAVQLVRTVVDSQKSIGITGDPGVNYPALARVVRHEMGKVQAVRELHGMLEAFDVAVTVADQAPAARQDVLSRRFALDSDPIEPEDEETTTTAPPEDEQRDDEVVRQASMINQALLRYLTDWQQTFPALETKVFPDDFEAAEQTQINKFVKPFVDAENSGIDLSSADIPDDVVTSLIEKIIDDADFPDVEGAKTAEVIKKCVRKLISNKKQAIREKKRKADAKAAAEGKTGGDDTDEQHPPKAARLELRYGADGEECAACFILGVRCSLLLEGMTRRGTPCNLCAADSRPCRLFCSECMKEADKVGRGAVDDLENSELAETECDSCKWVGV